MSIAVPEKNWFRAPEGAERIWIGLSLVWCLIMFLMMPYWHFKGKQNSTGEAYRVAPADFQARVLRTVETQSIGEENGLPIVEPPPGGDAYLLGRMWQWYPILKLKKDQTYRLHVSSMDLQHGFSLLPVNMNFHILPGYDHVLTITPTASGEYQVICNEFCGIGHHLMTGKIIVE
ncbi:MAG: cytochrome C oxidase subunit II [Acidobacteria bacterium]|nr:cytochrome C oxidase subunit II [Acidobacteriota bacterium]